MAQASLPVLLAQGALALPQNYPAENLPTDAQNQQDRPEGIMPHGPEMTLDDLMELANLDNDPTHLTAEEARMINVLMQVLGIPAEQFPDLMRRLNRMQTEQQDL